MKNLFAGIVVALFSLSVAAQWLGLPTPGAPRTALGEIDFTAPVTRTADGLPDLSGLWLPRAVRGDLPASDKLKPWVAALQKDRNQRFNADNPMNLCLPMGPGYLTESTATFGPRRFVQSEDMLVFLYSDLKYRQVFLDGRQLEDDPLPIWMGYSVGRWEGDTLVVESNGYNDRTWLHREGVGHSEQLRITERYTRQNFGTILVEIKYEDPGAFDAPLEVTMQLQFLADDELLEVVCNESSQGTQHYTGGESDVEAALVELSPEILARYVGSYEGIYIDSAVRVDVTLENGVLYLRRGNSIEELIPQGETAFIRGGWGYVFTVDEDGKATAVSEVHVSGGWTFPRIE